MVTGYIKQSIKQGALPTSISHTFVSEYAPHVLEYPINSNYPGPPRLLASVTKACAGQLHAHSFQPHVYRSLTARCLQLNTGLQPHIFSHKPRAPYRYHMNVCKTSAAFLGSQPSAPLMPAPAASPRARFLLRGTRSAAAASSQQRGGGLAAGASFGQRSVWRAAQLWTAARLAGGTEGHLSANEDPDH